MEAETLLRGIAEKRANVFEELKSVVDAVDPAVGFSAEARAKKDKLHADLDDLERRESVLKEQQSVSKSSDEARAVMERFTRPEKDDDDEVGGGDKRFLAWIRGEGPKAIEVDMRGLSREIRRLGGDQIEARVLTDGTLPAASGGGATVPILFRNQLYEHLTFNTAMRQTRASIITTENGSPFQLPKTTAHPSAGTIIPEGNTLQANDPSLGQGTLGAFKYGNIVQLSTELLTDSAIDLIGYLAKRFGIALANGSGAHYVTGLGAGASPQGFLIGAGTVGKFQGTTLSVGGAPQSNDIFETYHSIIPPYRQNAEWMLADSALKAIRELKSTTGQYLWSPGGLAGGIPSTLLDKPYVVDPNMPKVATSATSIAFGDFSAYFIRDVAGFRFERSDDFAFGTDLVSFRALLRTDGQMLDTTGAIGYFVGGTA